MHDFEYIKMQKLHCRKSIRLKNYDYSSNGYYFVTICVQNREKLFGEIVGATLCGRPNNPDKIIKNGCWNWKINLMI